MSIPDYRQLSPEENASKRQERDLIWSILGGLPENYREPLILYYRCGESTKAVAAALEESEANVRQLLKRGRDMIRDEINIALCRTLKENAPTSAFVGSVMATLPSSANAAGTTLLSSVAIKKSGLYTSMVFPAVAFSIGGCLIGAAGGLFGTWASWKKCKYKSQQRFVIRMAILYLIGLSIFIASMTTLAILRSQNDNTNSQFYTTSILTIFIIAQILNFIWIRHCHRGYERVTANAIRRNLIR